MLRSIVILITVGCAASQEPQVIIPGEPTPRDASMGVDALSSAVVTPDAAPAATTSTATLPPNLVTCADCGPAPGYPTMGCPDGVHTAGRGPCVKFVDGSCHWTHLVCPAASDARRCAGACGPEPVSPKWSCADDQVGELACVRDQNGACGLTERSCLKPTPRPPPPVAAFDAGAPVPRVSCTNLPSVAQLKTWPIDVVCQNGGGPAPPPLRKLIALGDDTFIFEGIGGCFRAREKRCLSK